MPRLPQVVLARLRARSTPQAVAEAAGARTPRENLAHPDANLLSGFVEKTLAERERAQILDHLSACAECREIVTLTLPAEMEAGVGAVAAAPARSALWPVLRWGALAAALGSMAIAIVVHRYPSRSPAMLAKPTQPTIQAMRGPSLPAPSVASLRKANHGMSATAKRTEPRVAREVQRLKTEPAASEVGEINAPLPRAKSTPARTLMAGDREPVAGIPLAPTAEGASASNAPDASPRPGTHVRVESHAAGVTDGAVRRQFKTQVTSPPSRWTITPAGTLQRSDDDGKTWTEITIDPGVKLSAVAAEGSEIWAGTTGCALYHSSNSGSTWKRVNLGAAEAIVSIQMLDAQHLTVFTEAGDHWTSEDSGQTWQREP